MRTLFQFTPVKYTWFEIFIRDFFNFVYGINTEKGNHTIKTLT